MGGSRLKTCITDIRSACVRDTVRYNAAKKARLPYSRSFPALKRVQLQLCDEAEAVDLDVSRLDLVTVWYIHTVWLKCHQRDRHKLVPLSDAGSGTAGSVIT